MSKRLARPDSTSVLVGGIRVVLVDDFPQARSALVRSLDACRQVRVVGQAQDGLEGFALAAQLKPDLVITDLVMPGLDGLGLVKLLRQNFPYIRSIVTSVHDTHTLQAVSRRHGADAFITKERLPEELTELLPRLFPDAS